MCHKKFFVRCTMGAHLIKFCHSFEWDIVFLVEVVPNPSQCDLLVSLFFFTKKQHQVRQHWALCCHDSAISFISGSFDTWIPLNFQWAILLDGDLQGCDALNWAWRRHGFRVSVIQLLHWQTWNLMQWWNFCFSLSLN